MNSSPTEISQEQENASQNRAQEPVNSDKTPHTPEAPSTQTLLIVEEPEPVVMAYPGDPDNPIMPDHLTEEEIRNLASRPVAPVPQTRRSQRLAWGRVLNKPKKGDIGTSFNPTAFEDFGDDEDDPDFMADAQDDS